MAEMTTAAMPKSASTCLKTPRRWILTAFGPSAATSEIILDVNNSADPLRDALGHG